MLNKIDNICLKKNYVYICIVLLLLSIYVIFLPLISQILRNISPQLVECVYLKNTGNPCALCGGTRYIQGLPNVLTDFSYLLNPFGFIMTFIFFEIIFRIIVIILTKKNKLTKTIIVLDIVLHTIFVILFVIYQMTFYMNN